MNWQIFQEGIVWFIDLQSLVVIIATAIVVGLSPLIGVNTEEYIPDGLKAITYLIVAFAGFWQLFRQRIF